MLSWSGSWWRTGSKRPSSFFRPPPPRARRAHRLSISTGEGVARVPSATHYALWCITVWTIQLYIIYLNRLYVIRYATVRDRCAAVSLNGILSKTRRRFDSLGPSPKRLVVVFVSANRQQATCRGHPIAQGPLGRSHAVADAHTYASNLKTEIAMHAFTCHPHKGGL